MTTTKIYVGTYGKYNAGNLAGAWLDLGDYADKDDFFEAAAKLHKDEFDPELMFMDWEGIPEGMVGECWVDEKVWAYIEADERERETWKAYTENVDAKADIDTALEAYAGEYDTPAHWAEEFMTDCMEISDNLVAYIDYEKFARDAGFDGMIFVGTYPCKVFYNN